ncbi:hypothetical protein CMT41_13880 [Colwellia sp. MT41]|uniref:DUF4856 domain-containing protein n=1 Tax=Colwellia sp. MT41 TaxID=58049 RepID=UPI0007177FDE|nr:DUF4856 domain-containing protein [Colwellia sp. MT41]ALO35684.1 hypothetical protein CMT41_13880 [Colwellia sp. MT41]
MKFQRKALAIAVMVATSALSACSSDDIEEIINLAPTEIKLEASFVLHDGEVGIVVDENEVGADIATLKTIDLDIEESFSYVTDNENFVIKGDKLKLADGYVLDYEKEQKVTFNITVTDKDSNEYTQEVTINVRDLFEHVPNYYDFASNLGNEDDKYKKSSVSYGGQVARHALIAELKHYIGKGGLQADLDNGDLPSKEAVIAKLNTYFDGKSEDWIDGVFPITFIDAKQKTFSDISSGHKTLKGKVAGNDNWGQSKDWNDGDFAGWGTKGTITPTGLIESFFEQLADNAMENLGGERYAPGTDTKIAVYVNYDGTDLNQLIQKFLLMSVTYAQGTDDYLNENKGLKADNITGDKDGDKNYTSLEHQFDEGFGYFGAARDYLAYNDNEIAGKVSSDEDGRSDWNGQHDTNADGKIDLMSEKNFGNSINAAKRDRGSKDNAAATDYTKQAMDAFLSGRKLINDNAGTALTEAQMTELLGYRDSAVDAWERAIAATVVHYINDLHADLAKVGTTEFDFATTAKHFSELKGFALGLQFNPYSPITDAQFKAMHVYFKDAPVLVGAADVTAYRADLIKARDILQTALSFDAENVANW